MQKAVSVKNWPAIQQAASKTSVWGRRFPFQSVRKSKKNFCAFPFDWRGLGLISRSQQQTFDRRCFMQWRGEYSVQICSMNTLSSCCFTRVPETFFISNNSIRDNAAAAIGAKVEKHLCARPKGIQDHSEWLRTAHSMTLPTVKHVRILRA